MSYTVVCPIQSYGHLPDCQIWQEIFLGGHQFMKQLELKNIVFQTNQYWLHPWGNFGAYSHWEISELFPKLKLNNQKRSKVKVIYFVYFKSVNGPVVQNLLPTFKFVACTNTTYTRMQTHMETKNIFPSRSTIHGVCGCGSGDIWIRLTMRKLSNRWQKLYKKNNLSCCYFLGQIFYINLNCDAFWSSVHCRPRMKQFLWAPKTYVKKFVYLNLCKILFTYKICLSNTKHLEI